MKLINWVAVLTAILAPVSFGQDSPPENIRPKETWKDKVNRGPVSGLRQHKINLEDRHALLNALQQHRSYSDTGQGYVPAGAAFVLAEMPKDDKTIAELKSALVSSKDEGVLCYTARALTKLGETDWPSLVRGRVHTMRDPVYKGQFAAALADAKEYEGWPVVRAMLLDPDSGEWKFLDALFMHIHFAVWMDHMENVSPLLQS